MSKLEESIKERLKKNPVGVSKAEIEPEIYKKLENKEQLSEVEAIKLATIIAKKNACEGAGETVAWNFHGGIIILWLES